MLRKIFFSLLLLFPSFFASAQIRNAIVAGAVAAQIDGDQMSGFNKAGIQFGGSSNFKVTESFSIQPEIMFTQKGSKTTDKNDYYLKYRLNYIALPVVASYRFHPRFTAQAGPSFDFLLSAKRDNGSGFEDVSDLLNRLDLGVTGGMEYTISDRFGLNIRYTYSALKISEPLGLRNNILAVSLRFYLGSEETTP